MSLTYATLVQMSDPGAGASREDVLLTAVLDGRYRLDATIGRGGMGTVYRALDTRLDRAVAIKLLRNTDSGNDERFAAEVRLLARFAHPHLVRILDAGELDGRPYLVMELIEGSTLARRVAVGPLAPFEVASIGAGIAAALGQVHAEGIVHRDVKPANVLLDRAGTAYLADFGIARLVDTTGITATGLLLGTPAYLAPEQIQGTGVGPPADVYALGLTLLESLTGQRSFEGTASEITAARLHRDPPIPPEIDEPWRSVLLAMTARQPEYRIAAIDAAARLGDLARPGVSGAMVTHAMAADVPTMALADGALWADGGTTRVAPTADRVAVTATEASAVAPPPPPKEGANRRRLLAVVAALGVLAVIGLVVAFATGGTPTASSQTTTTIPQTTTTVAPTTTAPSTTTTTTLPVPSLTTALSAVTGAIGSGASNQTIDPGVAVKLGNDAQEIGLAAASGAPDTLHRFDQLVSDYDAAVSSGGVVDGSVDAMDSAISTLAAALGTAAPVPAAATTTTTALGAGNSGPGPGGGGKGHGHGGG